MSHMNWRFGAVLGLIVIATGSIIAATAWAQGGTTFEPNTDRPGSDYFSFQLSSPQPTQCQQACIGDINCSAWTYVQPGIQGPQARCWLKNPSPAPIPSNCCVSGTKTAQQTPPDPPAPPPQPPKPKDPLDID
jgi:hypothetical protein